MSTDTSFNATGPSQFGYEAEGDLIFGAFIQGTQTGVLGRCVGPQGEGVIGVGMGPLPGVKGVGTATEAGVGPGVIGIGAGSDATSAPTDPAGVYGHGGAGNAIGVQGMASGDLHGVAGFADPTGSGAGVLGHDNGGANTSAGLFSGKVEIGGDLTVFGTKSAAVRFPDGTHRRLYCMESPERWFEDFGTSVLADGRAQVRLDPDFAATVDTDDYHVFLTEYDDNNALNVTERSATGFVVRAKASDTASGTFSYRVVAKRGDIEAPRLEKVTMPAIEFDRDLFPAVDVAEGVTQGAAAGRGV